MHFHFVMKYSGVCINQIEIFRFNSEFVSIVDIVADFVLHFTFYCSLAECGQLTYFQRIFFVHVNWDTHWLCLFRCFYWNNCDTNRFEISVNHKDNSPDFFAEIDMVKRNVAVLHLVYYSNIYIQLSPLCLCHNNNNIVFTWPTWANFGWLRLAWAGLG